MQPVRDRQQTAIRCGHPSKTRPQPLSPAEVEVLLTVKTTPTDWLTMDDLMNADSVQHKRAESSEPMATPMKLVGWGSSTGDRQRRARNLRRLGQETVPNREALWGTG